MPGTDYNTPQYATGIITLGTIYPGGATTVESNSAAAATVVTTVAPHGLATGDTVFFSTTTNSTPAIVNQEIGVISLSPTTYSLPVDCTGGAGNTGAYDYAILSIPTTGVGVPATVNTGTAHGLRPGDTVTLVATGSTPACNGAQVVTAVPTTTSFQIGAITNITVAGSTTLGHYSKTTFYSDIWDSGSHKTFLGLSLKSVMGHAGGSTTVDIQGSFTGDLYTATDWFNIAYATMAAPQTPLFAQLTVSTATTTNYKLAGPGEVSYVPFKFFRLKFGTSANIVMSARLYIQR